MQSGLRGNRGDLTLTLVWFVSIDNAAQISNLFSIVVCKRIKEWHSDDKPVALSLYMKMLWKLRNQGK